MKLIRGLIYTTVGLAVGLVLKRFLTEEQPEPVAPVPSAPPVSPSQKAKTEADDEAIAVVDLDATPAADAKPAATDAVTQKDDLTQINGIGPTYAKRLHAAGITTFAQLAAQDADRLREITKIKEWQAADPADWITTAKTIGN